MDNKIKKTLNNLIQKTSRHPFLFIGSGFSKRYIQTESWQELLIYFCKEYSNDDYKYTEYFHQVNDNEYYGQQAKIATLLEKDYNSSVFTNKKFNTFKKVHSELLMKGISPFKIAISEHLKNKDYDINNPEIVLLKKLSIRSIAGIITTNYDTLLENIFSNYKTYIGQNELIFSNLSEIGEIYKIHGSITNPSSIIITDKDYQQFEELSSYLISKISTIFLEYPIIFIGYSIQDRNIRNILETIAKCLPQDKLELLKERFIFIDYCKSKSISSSEFRFNNNKYISMTKISTDNFIPIYEAIYDVKSTYNPRLLQRLRQDIYKMATETEAIEKVVSIDFAELDNIPDDIHFVIGIGTSSHIFTAEEVYKDIILNNQNLSNEDFIKENLPLLLNKNRSGIAVYKYINKYKNIDKLHISIKKYIKKYNTLDAFLSDTAKKDKEKYRTKYSTLSINTIIQNEGFDNAYLKMSYLEKNEFDLNELKKYIKALIEKKEPSIFNTSKASYLKRLIRIYDYLKYGLPYLEKINYTKASIKE